ncbi:unnamed protein product [Fraxinus pennsylvanica]|uniref:Clp R domain-containing protein n=1 Tax=Fraxinus pennsylvanica TaxID=56036 RepID=A0AAD1ZH69_9LAMI|nr:unnamed protein product [Fraxinus pennsylvanica]
MNILKSFETGSNQKGNIQSTLQKQTEQEIIQHFAGENESKTVLDVFFLGKALAEALNERIESTLGEFLSTIGRLQAEQQKQVQEFQGRYSYSLVVEPKCPGEELGFTALDALADMAGALVQSTNLPFSVTSVRNGEFRRRKNTNRTVTMRCNLQTTPLRMRSFSGLRTSNAVDLMKQTGQTLQSKVAVITSVRKGRKCRHNYIGPEHLLLGLLREDEGVAARVLENLGADPSNIRTQVIRMVGERAEAIGAGVGGRSSGNKMPTLEEYGINLTKLAEGKIERITQILNDVGKTAIAEGLALRIANGDVPETIEGKKLMFITEIAFSDTPTTIFWTGSRVDSFLMLY